MPRKRSCPKAGTSQTEDFVAAIQWQERALSLLAENAPSVRRSHETYPATAKKPYHSPNPREEMGWKTHLPMSLSTE